MSTSVAPKVKIPLFEASKMLAELCHRLDEGEEPTAAIAMLFDDAQLSLAEALDRRKAVATALKSFIAA